MVSTIRLIFLHISKKSTLKFFDDNLIEGNTYIYSILPYYKTNEKEFLGEELFFDEIKVPRKNLGTNDDWWILED